MKNKNYRDSYKFVTGLLVVMIISFSVHSQQVTIGTGTAISVYSPINRSNDYSVYEVIYLASDIGMSGVISDFAFHRHDGTNTSPIDSVSIYMKHTTQTMLAAGNFSTSGYNLVYSGSFPNTAGSGWQEVMLNNPFGYNGINNLQVLAVKGYQQAVANTPVCPRWNYTDIAPNAARARRYFGDSAITSSTMLSALTYTSNARLTFGMVGIVEITPGDVTVYPNPSRGKILFRINRDLKFDENRLAIYSSLGETVYQNQVKKDEEIVLDHLSPGIYFYEFTGDENKKIKSGKLVVTY